MRLDRHVPGTARVVVIEVTNTLQASAVTGYQRFVRAFLRELGRAGEPALEIVPVVWEGRGYRRLTPAEDARLRQSHRSTGPAGAPAVRTHPALAPARALARRARTLRRRSLRYAVPAGAVFFDAEPAWHDPEPRDRLLPALRRQGVTVVTMVADVLPVTSPQWFEPRIADAFGRWLRAHLDETDLVLAISQFSADQVTALLDRDVPVRVVPLGADFAEDTDPVPVPLPAGLDRLLLVVGTLEPRKNQALALDLLDRLLPDHTDLGLVLVGKQGWLVEDLVTRLRTHPAYGERLLWLPGLGDAELSWLYQRATVALVPSWSEGLGLPVLEALRAGTPTITSTGGALPEAGAGLAETADPDDLDTWERLVRAHLDAPRPRAPYAAPTWEAAAQVVRESLATAQGAHR